MNTTESTNLNTPTNQTFNYTGTGLDFGLLMLKNIFFSVITLGIYIPWARTNNRRFIWSNVTLNGDRFTYTGTGKQLFLGAATLFAILFVAGLAVNIIQAFLPKHLEPVAGLLILPGYLYFFALAAYSGLRYRAVNTLWRQLRFGTDRTKESTKEFLLIFAKGFILTGLTLGLYIPIFTIKKLRFLTGKAHYSGKYFTFTGQESEYFLLCIKGFLLSVVTLGLYFPWFYISRTNYRIQHTQFGTNSFKFNLTGGEVFVYFIVGNICTILTLGLASPWVLNYWNKLFFNNLSIIGPLDLSNVVNTNTTENESALGDDVAVEYDIDFGF